MQRPSGGVSSASARDGSTTARLKDDCARGSRSWLMGAWMCAESWVSAVKQTVIDRMRERNGTTTELFLSFASGMVGCRGPMIDYFQFETSLRASQTGSLNLHSVRRTTRDTRRLDMTRNILSVRATATEASRRSRSWNTSTVLTSLEDFYSARICRRSSVRIALGAVLGDARMLRRGLERSEQPRATGNRGLGLLLVVEKVEDKDEECDVGQ